MRTFDLKSACRQLALSPEGKRIFCIRVFDPVQGCMRLFRCLVLPFGAVRSVHSFLRLARAIWWIGVTGCKLLWTSFYDDFISFSQPVLTRCTESTVVSLFKLLGWIFAEDGEKCVPFSTCCEARGMRFNLDGSARGWALVQNTASLVDDFVLTCQQFWSKGQWVQNLHNVLEAECNLLKLSFSAERDADV